MDNTLSVGDVAKRSGVAVSTLHYYEEKGLCGQNPLLLPIHP